MLIYKLPQDLQQQSQIWRQQQETIAFVPTMGNLHAGHLSLVEKAFTLASRVVVSIFVNPLQFGAGEDFNEYPRTFEADQAQLQQLKVSAIFYPTPETMYPQGMAYHTTVQVPEDLTNILCGQSRPGHFTGVATVVAKLLQIVQPHYAIFGEKDYQQLLVIRQMVTDLLMPVDIVSMPIYREEDGLAMSSRNRYLTQKQRQSAPYLAKTLQDIKEKILSGQQDFSTVINEAKQQLIAADFTPDYVEIRHAQDLKLPAYTDRPLVILIAAWLGKTRLIDNLIVE